MQGWVGECTSAAAPSIPSPPAPSRAQGYANIATPTFALPRKGLRQRYAADLQALYEGLDCPSAALPPASPEGAAAAATRGGARHASRLPGSSLAALRVSQLSESAAGLPIPRQGAEEAGATE